MLFLSNEDSKSDIHLYINSPGGSITAGLAVYDTMQFVRCDVATYCVGQAASMGAVLLAGGHAGKRHLLANNRVLVHQPHIMGVLEGPATDLDIEAQEILRLRNRLYEILAKHTGQTAEKIEKDCDRNLWLSAEEAIEYGLADRILQKAPEIVRDQDSEDDNE
jgi:ATP-dependent Clp protease protease subunit